ncbi:hypothetical protein CN128_09950, partial [Sinorhizobium meliloti]
IERPPRSSWRICANARSALLFTRQCCTWIRFSPTAKVPGGTVAFSANSKMLSKGLYFRRSTEKRNSGPSAITEPLATLTDFPNSLSNRGLLKLSSGASVQMTGRMRTVP